MLSYKEAVRKILKHSFLLRSRLVPLEKSLGLVLAKDIFALESLPNFDNSAVDGYAISLRSNGFDLPDPSGPLKLQGEVKAGEFFKGRLKLGRAIRIFTGAPIPRDTQAVAMQEDVKRVNGSVFLLRIPSANDNIRLKGEDIQKEKLLIRRGTILEPTHLALLAAVGYKRILVYPSPKIAIITTGSELLMEGEKLRPGKIYDCNSILLKALVRQIGGALVSFSRVRDNPKEIRAAICKGSKSDLLIISGGVSVGAYDFVKEILFKEGVKEIFWKVNIKPGKPIFFGRKNSTLVFGLPGNPVSVFVTFQEFVRPAIFKMMGKNIQMGGKQVEGYLTKPFQNGSRLHFVRVHCVRGRKGYAITPLKGQGSHMIGSLASSNALLQVKPNAILKRNQLVSVKLIGGE